MMAEHTPYQEQNFRDIQAGGFKKRSLLDRLNPFTPFSSKKFVPTAKGQEFLDKFKKDTGKNLVVLPIEQKAIDEMKSDIKSLKEDMNRGKGAAAIIILIGGLIGSIFYFFQK